tara:strand:+ start:47 stop:505 length:459 start_codon:yes stop_codon:yes gene_type:complete
MIASLLAVITSSTVGGIVGGVFGWLNRREDRIVNAQNQTHELRMIQARANAGQQISEARAFEESQKTVGWFAAGIKSAIRPIITGVLYWYVWKFIVVLQDITGGLESIDPVAALALYEMIMLSIVNLASMATSWWFASRPSGANTIAISREK